MFADNIIKLLLTFNKFTQQNYVALSMTFLKQISDEEMFPSLHDQQPEPTSTGSVFNDEGKAQTFSHISHTKSKDQHHRRSASADVKQESDAINKDTESAKSKSKGITNYP